MSDLIERQDAIDALGKRPMVWTDTDNYSLCQRNQYDSDRLAIEIVQSAEKRTNKRTETHECDCISRQDAINAVGSMLRRKFGIGGDLAEITLAGLPSAEPQIIRCKDCIESYRWIIGIRKCKRYKACVTDNDFCSRAERREDGGVA